MSPNLVAARFIQLTPAYTGGAVLPDGASIGLARTAVPVEWDEVKEALTQLAVQLGPTAGIDAGPVGRGRSTRPPTPSTATATRSTTRCASCRKSPGGWGFAHRPLRHGQEPAGARQRAVAKQRADRAVRRARGVGVAGARRQLDAISTTRWARSTRRCRTSEGFLHENNSTLIDTVNKLTDFTQTLTDQSDEHRAGAARRGPTASPNFYNIYDPAQGTVNGLLSLPNFANPVQFICGGTFDTRPAVAPDYYKRAEICRRAAWARCCAGSRELPADHVPPDQQITAYKGQIIYDTPDTEAKAETPVPYLTWIPAPRRRHRRPPATPTDLQSLLVPTAPDVRPGPRAAPGPAPAPRPVPGAAAPRPGAGPDRCRPSREPADEPNLVARQRIWSLGSVLLAGCQFGGLNSLYDARHGRARPRLLHDHRRTARRGDAAAELAGDGRRRHRRQCLGHRRPCSGSDGSFYRRSEVGAGQERRAAGQRDREGRPDLAAGFACTSSWPHRSDEPAIGRLERRSRDPAESDTGRYPDHRGSASRRWAWWSTRAMSVRWRTSPTRPIKPSRAAQDQFADLVPRLAELTAALNRQVNDIIAAVEGLNRFSGNPGAQTRTTWAARWTRCPRRSRCSTRTAATSSRLSPRCSRLRDGHLARPVARPRTTSPPTSRTCTR